MFFSGCGVDKNSSRTKILAAVADTQGSYYRSSTSCALTEKMDFSTKKRASENKNMRFKVVIAADSISSLDRDYFFNSQGLYCSLNKKFQIASANKGILTLNFANQILSGPDCDRVESDLTNVSSGEWAEQLSLKLESSDDLLRVTYFKNAKPDRCEYYFKVEQ